MFANWHIERRTTLKVLGSDTMKTRQGLSWKHYVPLLFCEYGVILVAEVLDRPSNKPLAQRLLAEWPLFLIATITVVFVALLGLRGGKRE